MTPQKIDFFFVNIIISYRDTREKMSYKKGIHMRFLPPPPINSKALRLAAEFYLVKWDVKLCNSQVVDRFMETVIEDEIRPLFEKICQCIVAEKFLELYPAGLPPLTRVPKKYPRRSPRRYLTVGFELSLIHI